MRLNPFNPNNISVREGGGGGFGFPGGGGGQLGCGGIIIALIGALVFGINPAQMLGGMQGSQQEAPGPQGNRSVQELCTQNTYATEACNALQSLNQTWEPVFKQANIPFTRPTLVFYHRGTQSGCGAAQSAMGPFYCPEDQSIYIDTSFYDEMQSKLGTGPGDFARYYVIAHEYGHHVQKLTGVSDQISSLEQQDPGHANQASVMLELQADCYAGVWAGKNRNAIEPGDFEEGMKAANAIGDDTLEQRSGQEVMPDSFTHGTSAQRMEALRTGMESGDDSKCDRYVQSGRA